MTGREWVKEFARRIEADPPTDAEFDEVLRLAAVAAHSSERVAAPVAAWMAGRAGLPLSEAVEVADGIGQPE